MIKNKRLKIGIDLDSVLNNLNEVWIDVYNKDYSDNLTNEDILTWDIASYTKPECGNKMFDYLLTPNFFRDLGMQPDAREVVEWLSQWADLYIVTAYHWECCKDKVLWVKKNLPNFDEKNVIFCNDKSVMDLDYLIDDRDLNIETFHGTGIIFDQPYNRNMSKEYFRAYDWISILNYFKGYFRIKI